MESFLKVLDFASDALVSGFIITVSVSGRGGGLRSHPRHCSSA